MVSITKNYAVQMLHLSIKWIKKITHNSLFKDIDLWHIPRSLRLDFPKTPIFIHEH